jgi:ParB-like chromosome segregation protein Spo0J
MNSGDTSPEGQPSLSNCAGAQGADAKAPRLRRLRISDISVGNRLLDINEDNVLALMNSITDVGLIQPIAVSYYGRGHGGRSSYGVNVGAHRLEAHKRLGLKEIDAVIIDLPGRKGMLAEIDENLIRRDLTDAERAKLTAERKRIYELDHPETKHGGDRKGSTRQNGDLKRFTEDTAEKTGRSERSVQRDAARGEALSPEVLDKVKGTVLDKGTELDALARLPEDEQRALAERAKAGEQVSAKVAKVEETQAPTETDDAATSAETEDQIDGRHYCYRADGSKDRGLERFSIAMAVMCTAEVHGTDNIKFPPNLPAKAITSSRAQIKEAIKQLRKLDARLAAYVVSEPPPDDTPPDPGPTPDGETDAEPTGEAPQAGSTVSAVEEQTAAIDRSLDIPDPLIQAARQRHPVASAPQHTPVPLTPPAPTPTPSPSPSPAPTPAPSPKLKVAPHYLPAHRDPWPKDWRSLGAAELEDVISKTQAFGVNHRLEDRHHRQLDKMRERLGVLRAADRAERPQTTAEARVP